MAISKRMFHEFTERDMEQYREYQYQEYMEELESEAPTEWLARKEMKNEWDATLEQQEDILCELADKAEEGSELEAYTTLKEIKRLIDQTLKQIEPLALDKCELESPDNRPFTKNGFEIQRRNGGRYIDFSNCDQVKTKEDELKAMKESYKHCLIGIEKGVTTLSDGMMLMSDGELVNIPTWKYKKDSIVVKKL